MLWFDGHFPSDKDIEKMPNLRPGDSNKENDDEEECVAWMKPSGSDAAGIGWKTLKGKVKRSKWKRRLILRHHKFHFMTMARDTIPLFVAAMIARAVTDVLNLIDSKDIQSRIIIFVVYSLCVAHLIGYLVNIYSPHDNVLSQYFVSIANDNASFAWSTTLTLIILSWLYEEHNVWTAVTAWLVLLLVVFAIILAASYLQQHRLHVGAFTSRRLRVFESEAFALSIAYSLTVIVAASTYQNESTDYLSNTDDLNSISDDQNKPRASVWAFVAYLVVITLGMMIYQRHLLVNHKNLATSSQWRPDELHNEQRLEGNLHEALLRDAADDHGHSSDAVALIEDDDCDDDDCDDDFSGPGSGDDEDDLQDVLIEEYLQPEAVQTIAEQRNPQTHISQPTFFTRCFERNHQRYVRLALKSCAHTFVGYLVSSGWTVWALLTFQNLFAFHAGAQFGLFLYSLIVTALVSLLLTAITARRGIRDVVVRSSALNLLPAALLDFISESPSEKLASSRCDVILAFARLTVGWAWQEFFSSVIAAMIREGDRDRAGLVAMLKVLFALLVFVLGARFEIWIFSAGHGHGKSFASNTSGLSPVL